LSFANIDCCHRSTLNGIIEKITNLQSMPPLKRAWTFVKDPEKIGGMRKEFDDAIGLFQVCINVLSFVEKVLILVTTPQAKHHDHDGAWCQRNIRGCKEQAQR
jgi:hypothetical protein